MDPSASAAVRPWDKYLSTSCSGKLRVIAAASRVPTKLRDDALISGLHVTQHSIQDPIQVQVVLAVRILEALPFTPAMSIVLGHRTGTQRALVYRSSMHGCKTATLAPFGKLAKREPL